MTISLDCYMLDALYAMLCYMLELSWIGLIICLTCLTLLCHVIIIIECHITYFIVLNDIKKLNDVMRIKISIKKYDLVINQKDECSHTTFIWSIKD